MPKKHKALIIFIFLEIFLAILVWQANFTLSERKDLAVHFFDVGQGDAIFLEVSGGNQILVDGGPSGQILSKLSEVMPFWDRSIDVVILTHPHADHVVGLIDVLKRYNVSIVLESGVQYDTADYRAWQEAVKKEKAMRVIAQSGQVIQIGEMFQADVLAPLENFDKKEVSHPHDANVVLMVNYGKTRLLLSGDMERGMEYRLLEQFDLDADILKVGHHGSKTSSSDAFLAEVTPEVAVIQAGKNNRYGHPHPEVIERLRNLEIRVLRTDVDGDVEVVVDPVRDSFVVEASTKE